MSTFGTKKNITARKYSIEEPPFHCGYNEMIQVDYLEEYSYNIHNKEEKKEGNEQ